MKKILVTGGAGFIGSHVVEKLIKLKYKVSVYDDLSTGKLEYLQKCLKKIKFFKGSITNISYLKEASKGIDCILHQAALRSVPKSIDNPLKFNQVNAGGTLNILQAAKYNKVKKVIFASSSSVYGIVKRLPILENMPKNPISPYSVSKLAGEYYCRLFSDKYKLPTVILRYFNVYGPRQPLESKYAMAIPKFITSLLRGKKPPIHDDGKQTRDFTYVDDVAAANILAMNKPGLNGEAFNIASGERYSVLELIGILNKITSKNIEPIFLPHRIGDVRHTLADISKAKKILKYSPKSNFVKGLGKTVKYFEGRI